MVALQSSPHAANRTALRRTAPHHGAGDGARDLFERRDDDRRLRAFRGRDRRDRGRLATTRFVDVRGALVLAGGPAKASVVVEATAPSIRDLPPRAAAETHRPRYRRGLGAGFGNDGEC